MGWPTKAARRRYTRQYQRKNRGKLNSYQRAYYARNKAKKRRQARSRYLKNRLKLLARSRRNYRKAVATGLRYGRGYPPPTRRMPPRCECCGRKQKRALALDHCHITKKFRGWLCTQCNTGIGHLGDGLKGVRLAARYLEKNQ